MKKRTVYLVCPFCGNEHSVVVNSVDYKRWQEGELIQRAMPNLSPTQREQLISGLCHECQRKVFG